VEKPALNVLQLLGDKVSKTQYWGFAPGLKVRGLGGGLSPQPLAQPQLRGSGVVD